MKKLSVGSSRMSVGSNIYKQLLAEVQTDVFRLNMNFSSESVKELSFFFPYEFCL